MKISFNDMLYALSYGLDCVEREVVGVSKNHGRRVACISVILGRECGMDEAAQSDLAACAVLHDCALTEYLRSKEAADDLKMAGSSRDQMLLGHCIMGEDNIKELPFCGDVTGVILYHHERADGHGPFGKHPGQIPLAARLIHFADMLDVNCDLGSGLGVREQQRAIRRYLEQSRGAETEDELAELYFRVFTEEQLGKIIGQDPRRRLDELLPDRELEDGTDALYAIARLFGRIIDYKSSFTSLHSMEFADKAKQMAVYYGWDEQMQAKLYFAGALHDVGKLAISSVVLEKPGKLSPQEYQYIQDHVTDTWKILSRIRGIEDIARWASRHHEKLDGSGYPFGLKAGDLNQMDRLMACIDIYQALVEPRPYKTGQTHEQVMAILRGMVEQGYLDGSIVEDLDRVFKPQMRTS